MANKQPTLQERYKRLMAGTWTIYIDWTGTLGTWHYEQHNPNRNPPYEGWSIFQSGITDPEDITRFFESEAIEVIDRHIIEINKRSKK